MSGNELAIIDFYYTGYKNNISHDSISEKAKLHEALDRDIAERLGIPTFKSKIAIEGGGLETNGKGTLIQVEAVTLGRNAHLTKEEIEAEYARCCGISNVIWLPKGVADDPYHSTRIVDNIFGIGTGGHTDEFVRFANDSTILLSWVEEEERELHPINELNYQILTKSYEILSEAVDANGRKFNIVKIPHPSPYADTHVVEEDWFESEWWKEHLDEGGIGVGDTIFWSYSCSYLNHLIANEIILLPQFGDPIKDDEALSVFNALYPDRKIVGISPLLFNKGGGGMYCRYQTQPAVE
jgi:agmatine deiminase